MSSPLPCVRPPHSRVSPHTRILPTPVSSVPCPVSSPLPYPPHSRVPFPVSPHSRDDDGQHAETPLRLAETDLLPLLPASCWACCYCRALPCGILLRLTLQPLGSGTITSCCMLAACTSLAGAWSNATAWCSFHPSTPGYEGTPCQRGASSWSSSRCEHPPSSSPPASVAFSGI